MTKFIICAAIIYLAFLTTCEHKTRKKQITLEIQKVELEIELLKKQLEK